MWFVTLKNKHSKYSVFASSGLWRLIFTLNFVVFVDEGRKNISCSRAQGTLAMPQAWHKAAEMGTAHS